MNDKMTNVFQKNTWRCMKIMLCLYDMEAQELMTLPSNPLIEIPRADL